MTAYHSDQGEQGSTNGLEAARQEIIDRLTDAFAADAITMEEYEHRAAEASAAMSRAELERLSYDLPMRKPAQDTHYVRGVEVPRTGYTAPRGNSSLVGASPMTTGCVMGDRSLTGNWLTSDNVASFTVMGSTKMDLRDVDLPPGPVRIEAFTLMGETKIIVPRGLPVKLATFAFMGESRAARDVNQQIQGASTWVEISGFAMMGSVTVQAKD